ncbi:TonB-dependent siderophore vulnibactin receptor VvuA [Vibrio vulnificus]|uniref:TonB-dependent siderophore vulnibactin receptor VvuA n=1 Tax=Vibrio vulnificus TaxID=672 RepID=UPI001CDB4C06|nr:TonB-dependent siderophore vulnibactin receptor VvuA [Vibrio vulnificus]EHK8974098.1 TonB-dependent siderophore vulnibactin receptor VvuA [Vibrio vulnificus]EKA7354801.1 TonB-dependent siderophore vulnibactin receptor VvuA [Vibrio vulnificus]MCA3914048.1 TonB-dependent siderophore vulnibactin receptor VvuA [Vibrio vulnificus]MCG6314107.1 TonB-dependent siderophore vulnibactin receptor VvuA [Vibrio vulnificus]
MAALRPARTSVAENKIFKLHALSAVVMGLCASGQAYAQTESTNSNKKEEMPVVVVIGEKTERTIYDTSSSVQVFDQETIDNTPGATEIDDLLQLIPNMVDSGQGNSMPTVRGIDGSGPSTGGLASFAGTSPRLNMSIDGRSLTYSEIAFGPRSLWDMQQVEVYLGPQSYIQGRNASAGAIVMKTNDPTHHFESAVKAGIGERNYSQTAAMISAPIIQDELAFRLSFDQQKRDSFVDLASYEPAGDAKKIEMNSVRGKLLYEPSALAGFKTTLGVSHMDSRGPQSESTNVVGNEAFRPVYETKSLSTAWDISWQLNEVLTFENNLVYSKFAYDRYTNPTPRQKGDFTTEGKEFHVEPLLRYLSLDGRVNALVGARYYKSSQDDEYIDATSANPMSGSTKTQSAFAELTYALTQSIDVTVAGRYEKERVKRKVSDPRFKLDHDDTLSVFLPKFDIAFKPDMAQTFGFKVAKGYNAGGAGLAFNSIQFAGFSPYQFEDEYIWNYEFYTRHRLGNSVELMTNTFYNDFDNMQMTQTLSNGDVLIANLDSAKTYGAEIGTRWYATDSLELFANLGLLGTEYKEASGDSKDLPRAPSMTGNLGGQYSFFDGFELSANAAYTGDYYSDRSNTAITKVDAYWVANAQLAYVFENGRATLFATNLFDSNKTTLYTSSNLNDQLTQQPRMIGASLQLNF